MDQLFNMQDGRRKPVFSYSRLWGENPSLSPNYPLTTNAHWLQEKKNIYLTGFKFSTASSSIFLGSLSASLPPKSSLNTPSAADLAPLVRNELFSPWPLSLLLHGKQRGVHTQQAPREPGTSLSARLSSHKTSHCPLCFAFRSTWSPQADSASSPSHLAACYRWPTQHPSADQTTKSTKQQQIPLFSMQILPPVVVTSSSKGTLNFEWERSRAVLRTATRTHRYPSCSLCGPLMSHPR